MDKFSVLAITKNGIKIGLKLKSLFPSCKIYAPNKFLDTNLDVNWFSETTTKKIGEIFTSTDALVCVFSLGAVIRLIAPFLKDKKTDPAVIVIDDKANFVISTLSGHLGGANQLTLDIAHRLESTPVITTAADVNKTIPVDLIGKDFGWKIDNQSQITKVSAHMVNEEKIGVFQDSGEKNWWVKEMPKNVTIYSTLKELIKSNSKGYLIISDKTFDLESFNDAVIYRPLTLIVGIGLHWNTTKEKIRDSLKSCLKKYCLSPDSIAKFVSIKKEVDVKGLIELGNDMNIPIEYVKREDLAKVSIPNPSSLVKSFEGTASVAEAAALKVSGGNLIVEKQKFSPDLTIAIARVEK